MSKYKDPSALQKAVDQIGVMGINDRYAPRGMKVYFCEIHGAYLSPIGEQNPTCPLCQAATTNGNGTTATQVEHFINVRDMVAPPTNPHE